MSKILIISGLALVALGLLYPWVERLGLGRLPGDFSFSRGGLRVYFPLATSLLLSVVVSLLFWLFRRD